MKKLLFASILLLSLMIITACNNDDENESIVGTWRSTYVSSDGYNMSIAYVFKNNGEYSSSTSYRGDGLPTMQLNTTGVYTFSGSSLYIIEKAYNFFDEKAGGSSGTYEGSSDVNTWTFPAKIIGKSLQLSDFKLSALYIGEIKFKKE